MRTVALTSVSLLLAAGVTARGNQAACDAIRSANLKTGTANVSKGKGHISYRWSAKR